MDSLEEWLTQPGGLAERLQALRVRAGLTGKQLADTAGWAQSKISRLEAGKQKPDAADIATWGRLTDASEREIAELHDLAVEARVASATFKARMKGGQGKIQEDYAKLAAQSTLICHFETVYVPGPLQIPDYMRRVLGEMVILHGKEASDIEAGVTQRQRRADMLYEPGRNWEFLLYEPVLHSTLPAPADMHAQLVRLQGVIGMDRVRFGIIPQDTHLAITPQNKFEIYAGQELVAVVETAFDERPYRGEGAAFYRRYLDLLWGEAVGGDGARDLIMRAMQALPA